MLVGDGDIPEAMDPLSVPVFSGYSLAEPEQIEGADQVLAMTDVPIAGRYVRTRHHGKGLPGSSNQQLHFLSDRYSRQELTDIPEAEILIDASGQIVVTGVEPPTTEAGQTAVPGPDPEGD